MSELTVTEQPKPKQRQKRVNYALAGTLLASGLHYDQIAPQVGSSSGESLRTALHRKGVTMRQVRNIEPENERRLTVTAKLATEAETILREQLNGSLDACVAAFNTKKPTRKTLASRGQGDAATLKQLAETWRTLNGNPDSITFSFGASRMSEAREIPQPIVDCGSVTDVPQTIGTPPVQAPDNV